MKADTRPCDELLCSLTRPDSTAYQPLTGSPAASMISPLCPATVNMHASRRLWASAGKAENQGCPRMKRWCEKAASSSDMTPLCPCHHCSGMNDGHGAG